MASRDASRPNIVVVQTDDQGAWAMPHSNDDLIAPHLRTLIDSGTRFDNFYCASPVCSPARASLLTGRMPSAHGVHDWVRGAAYGVPDADGFLRRELHDALTTWFRLHTHPALDAFHRPVSGRGQLLPLHSDEPDEHVYYAGTRRDA